MIKIDIQKYNNLIDPEEMQKFLDILKMLGDKLDICLEKKQEFYGKRSELTKKTKIYQNEVEDDELDALFNIDGKIGITPEGKEVQLLNSEQRKAFLKLYSKESRKRLLELEAELSTIKFGLEEAESEYSHTLNKIKNVKYFLEATGNTLNFLASNGKIQHVIDINSNSELNMNELRTLISDITINTNGVVNVVKELNSGLVKASKLITEKCNLVPGVTATRQKPRKKKHGK